MFQPTASHIIKCKFGVLNFYCLVLPQGFAHRNLCLFLSSAMKAGSKTCLTMNGLKYRLNKSPHCQMHLAHLRQQKSWIQSSALTYKLCLVGCTLTLETGDKSVTFLWVLFVVFFFTGKPRA